MNNQENSVFRVIYKSIDQTPDNKTNTKHMSLKKIVEESKSCDQLLKKKKQKSK